MLDHRLEAAISKSINAKERARSYYMKSEKEFALMLADISIGPLGDFAKWTKDCLSIKTGKNSAARASLKPAVLRGAESEAVLVDNKLLLLVDGNKRAIVYEPHESNEFAICYTMKIKK